MDDLLQREQNNVLLHRTIRFVPAAQFSSRVNHLLLNKSSHRILHLKSASPKHPPLPHNDLASSAEDTDTNPDLHHTHTHTHTDLFPETLVRANLSWRNIRGAHAGIYNAGNTCFLNSVLQCLVSTPPLAQLAETNTLHRHVPAGVDGVVAAFVALCREMRGCTGHARHAVSATWFVKHLQRLAKNLRAGLQHDAHEFLRGVLDAVQRESLSAAVDDAAGNVDHLSNEVVESTVVHKVFGGRLESRVKCGNHKCLAVSNTVEAFLDLSLGVAAATSVEDCLVRFTKEEELGEGNKWKCPHCEQLVQASKRLTLERCPNVLVLHFKRFGYGRLGRKVRAHIKFDTTLRLRPPVLKEQGQVLYRLYAVLVHSGRSASSGHYVCFSLAANGLWYEMNDAKVRQVSVHTVLAQEAYMLFYTNASSDTQPTTGNVALKEQHYLLSFWPRLARSTARIIRKLCLTNARLLHTTASGSKYAYPIVTRVQKNNEASGVMEEQEESVQLVRKMKHPRRVQKGAWREELKKERKRKVEERNGRGHGDRVGMKRKYVYDDWDELLDSGRVKKIKSKAMEMEMSRPISGQAKKNPFQQRANQQRQKQQRKLEKGRVLNADR